MFQLDPEAIDLPKVKEAQITEVLSQFIGRPTTRSVIDEIVAELEKIGVMYYPEEPVNYDFSKIRISYKPE
jgi:hypothetical protein